MKIAKILTCIAATLAGLTLTGCGTDGNSDASSTPSPPATRLSASGPGSVPAGDEFEITAGGDAKLITLSVAARGSDETWMLTGIPEGEEGAPTATKGGYLTGNTDAPTDGATFSFDPETTPDTYAVCVTLTPSDDDFPADQDFPTQDSCVVIDVTSPEQKS